MNNIQQKLHYFPNLGDTMLHNQEKASRGTEQMPFACYRLIRNQKDILITKPHWHNEFEILYIKKGKINLITESESLILSVGDIAFVSPNEIHSIKSCDQNVEYFALVISEALITFPEKHFFQQQFTSPVFLGQIKLPRSIPPSEDFYETISSSLEKICAKADYGDPEILSLLLHCFIQLIKNNALINQEKQNRRIPTSIKQSLDFMKKNYQHKITLSDLAASAHLSQNYFCSCFKGCTGVTPFEQLHLIRIEKAVKLLLSTDSSIEEIAAMCGFENTGFFIRVFKKQMSTTPHNYRKISKTQ